MCRERLLWVGSMIFVVALLRVLPHPPNFTPIAAIALFGGAVLSNKKWAVGIPLLAMLVSDWIIGFHSLVPLIYGSFIAIVLLGGYLSERRRLLPIALASSGAAVFFFVVSNFGVWTLGILYPRTLEGLLACYVAALPFFQNTLLGTLFYSALLFGGLHVLERGLPRLRETQPA